MKTFGKKKNLIVKHGQNKYCISTASFPESFYLSTLIIKLEIFDLLKKVGSAMMENNVMILLKNSCYQPHLPPTLNLWCIHNKPLLPLCNLELGCFITKYARWNILMKNMYDKHISPFIFSVCFTIVIKVESSSYDNLRKVNVNWSEISWSENWWKTRNGW